MIFTPFWRFWGGLLIRTESLLALVALVKDLARVCALVKWKGKDKKQRKQQQQGGYKPVNV